MSLPLFLAAQIEDTFLKVRECSSDSDIARDCFSLRFFSGKVKNLSGLNFTFFAVYFWFLFKFSLLLCLKEGKLHNRTTKVYEIVSLFFHKTSQYFFLFTGAHLLFSNCLLAKFQLYMLNYKLGCFYCITGGTKLKITIK